MDGRVDIPFTPPYARDPAAASTGANSSMGSSSFASTGAPPTTNLARGLFMAPQTTSAAGGGAPMAAINPRALFSKLPDAVVAKKGKVPWMKNKVADGSYRWSKKRLAGHAKDAEVTEALASSLSASAANAYKLTIAHNLFQGEEKKTKKGKMKIGRSFTLPHCYEELKQDEKWKPREGVNEETNKHKSTIDLDEEEEASSDDGNRSPTPNLVAYSKPKRPNGGKKDAEEKKKRKGDDEQTIAMEAIVNAMEEANEVRKMARNQVAVVEERRLAAEERRVAIEEMKEDSLH
ncbi:Tyrosine N-monooxygenase [Hordeum vulgare]|nr:Tyrosine N-monooxygenase [Hordeum vulgare]